MDIQAQLMRPEATPPKTPAPLQRNTELWQEKMERGLSENLGLGLSPLRVVIWLYIYIYIVYMYIWSKGVEHVWFWEEWCHIAPKAHSFPAWFATCQGKRSHDTRSQVGHWRHWAMDFFPKMSHLHSRWLCHTMLAFLVELEDKDIFGQQRMYNTFMHICKGASSCQTLPKESTCLLMRYDLSPCMRSAKIPLLHL